MVANNLTTVHACSVAKRIAKRLIVSAETLVREGVLSTPFRTAGNLNCETIKWQWNEWTRGRLAETKGRRHDVLSLGFKGCKILFDEPCERCDGPLAKEAKNKWLGVISHELFSREGDLTSLRVWSERVLRKWHFQPYDGVYVPDQSGCYEATSKEGGTFSVREEDEEDDPRLCRLAVAKTKGKLRVVTMQTARAKREFRPVHHSLYRYLSRKGMVVRGEVTPDHFATVEKSRQIGDSIISGDYTSATDLLHSDAVRVVIDVIANKLPPELGERLRRSFSPEVRLSDGSFRKILRGAMMGNLVSFPVLCLINRYCIERSLKECSREYHGRDILVNGDDCCFAGDKRVYQTWRKVTSLFGLVVNETKTGFSLSRAEFNSQLWENGRIIRKLCFGFLGKTTWRSSCPTEPLLKNEVLSVSPVGALFDTVSKLRFSTAAFLLTHPMVQDVLTFVRPSASQIPRRWLSFLRKKRFFRKSILGEEMPELNSNLSIPMSYGPLILPDHESFVRDLEEECVDRFVEEWRGVKRVRSVPKREKKAPGREILPRVRISRSPPSWVRIWVTSALDLVREEWPDLLFETNSEWVDDVYGLTTTRSWNISASIPPPQPYKDPGWVRFTDGVWRCVE